MLHTIFYFSKESQEFFSTLRSLLLNDLITLRQEKAEHDREQSFTWSTRIDFLKQWCILGLDLTNS